MRDPAGAFSKYYSDLDCIIDDALWSPHVWEDDKALYSWGPPPPPSFANPRRRRRPHDQSPQCRRLNTAPAPAGAPVAHRAAPQVTEKAGRNAMSLYSDGLTSG